MFRSVLLSASLAVNFLLLWFALDVPDQGDARAKRPIPLSGLIQPSPADGNPPAVPPVSPPNAEHGKPDRPVSGYVLVDPIRLSRTRLPEICDASGNLTKEFKSLLKIDTATGEAISQRIRKARENLIASEIVAAKVSSDEEGDFVLIELPVSERYRMKNELIYQLEGFLGPEASGMAANLISIGDYAGKTQFRRKLYYSEESGDLVPGISYYDQDGKFLWNENVDPSDSMFKTRYGHILTATLSKNGGTPAGKNQ